MQRKEYDKAVAILSEEGYPLTAWDSDYEIQTAKRLERRYPEEILKYYLSGLGNLKTKAVRKEYARKAKVMAKARRLLVEVLKDKERWRTFAVKVKQDNIKCSAFQEEFAKVVPGWRGLK
jgi:predicted methyltransferase